jgi:DNA-binding NarL/FixJ family response regulator
MQPAPARLNKTQRAERAKDGEDIMSNVEAESYHKVPRDPKEEYAVIRRGWAMLTVEQANSMWFLTPREHQITTLASAGLSNKEIARRLYLAEGTVKVHLHNIFQKVRVRSRTALSARFYHRSSANGHALDLVGAQVINPGEPINAVHFAA